MEEPYNQTSAYPTHNDSATSDFENSSWTYSDDIHFPFWSEYYGHDINLVTTCVMFSFAFLGLCTTVYGLYSAVRSDRFVPVYIINIFICDLIQTSAILILMSEQLLAFKGLYCNGCELYTTFWMIYNIGVLINICFMVCISADRYVMIAYPVWHRKINSTRVTAFVSITVWVIFAVLTVIAYFFIDEHLPLCRLLALILPYPLVITFFVGTWRALSRNTRFSPQDQRRIMGTLALVLFIYTILFLPCIIFYMYNLISGISTTTNLLHFHLAILIVQILNPPFDFLLYLVIRRDAEHILSALYFCFCKKHEENSDIDTMTENQV